MQVLMLCIWQESEGEEDYLKMTSSNCSTLRDKKAPGIILISVVCKENTVLLTFSAYVLTAFWEKPKPWQYTGSWLSHTEN